MKVAQHKIVAISNSQICFRENNFTVKAGSKPDEQGPGSSDHQQTADPAPTSGVQTKLHAKLHKHIHNHYIF